MKKFIILILIVIAIPTYYFINKNNNIVDSQNLITVSLEVDDSFYKNEIKEGSTVYDAMTKFEGFSFKSQNYSSLGIFVYEINEVGNSPNNYWIYYVNNVKASVGVSKYILESGDIIKWKQEKSL